MLPEAIREQRSFIFEEIKIRNYDLKEINSSIEKLWEEIENTTEEELILEFEKADVKEQFIYLLEINANYSVKIHKYDLQNFR